MTIYNIVNFVIKNEKIFINLDKFFSLEDGDYEFQPKQVSTSLPILTFKEEDIDKYPLFNNVKMVQSESIEFKAAYLKECKLIPKYTKEKIYTLTSFTYELPTEPTLALYVIAVFDNYLTQIKGAKNYFNKNFIRDKLDKDGKLSISLCDVAGDMIFTFNAFGFDASAGWTQTNNHRAGRNAEYSHIHSFLEAIDTTSDIPSLYLPVIENFKKYYQFCEIEQLSIAECLNDNKLNQLISTGKNPYLLLNNLDPTNQLAIVDECNTKLKAEGFVDLIELKNLANNIVQKPLSNSAKLTLFGNIPNNENATSHACEVSTFANTNI